MPYLVARYKCFARQARDIMDQGPFGVMGLFNLASGANALKVSERAKTPLEATFARLILSVLHPELI